MSFGTCHIIIQLSRCPTLQKALNGFFLGGGGTVHNHGDQHIVTFHTAGIRARYALVTVPNGQPDRVSHQRSPF